MRVELGPSLGGWPPVKSACVWVTCLGVGSKTHLYNSSGVSSNVIGCITVQTSEKSRLESTQVSGAHVRAIIRLSPT